MMKATRTTTVLPPPTANLSKQLAPYLKVSVINAKGTTKVNLLGTGRKSNSQFGEGVDVDCKIGNKEYTWTIRRNCANYRILFERFGSDLANWKGIVKVERKEFAGNEYVAVVEQPGR
jgi:hypothetical protein